MIASGGRCIMGWSSGGIASSGFISLDHRQADHQQPNELHAELYERLDRPELAVELNRPVADIIAEISRDLSLAAIPGMNDPWKRRTRPALRPCTPTPQRWGAATPRDTLPDAAAAAPPRGAPGSRRSEAAAPRAGTSAPAQKHVRCQKNRLARP